MGSVIHGIINRTNSIWTSMQIRKHENKSKSFKKISFIVCLFLNKSLSSIYRVDDCLLSANNSPCSANRSKMQLDWRLIYSRLTEVYQSSAAFWLGAKCSICSNMSYPICLKAYIAFVTKKVGEGKMSKEEGKRLISQYESKLLGRKKETL